MGTLDTPTLPNIWRFLVHKPRLFKQSSNVQLRFQLQVIGVKIPKLKINFISVCELVTSRLVADSSRTFSNCREYSNNRVIFCDVMSNTSMDLQLYAIYFYFIFMPCVYVLFFLLSTYKLVSTDLKSAPYFIFCLFIHFLLTLECKSKWNSTLNTHPHNTRSVSIPRSQHEVHNHQVTTSINFFYLCWL